jgi:hypothetical protein
METPNFQPSRLPRVSSEYRDVGHTSVGRCLGATEKRRAAEACAVPEGDLDGAWCGPKHKQVPENGSCCDASIACRSTPFCSDQHWCHQLLLPAIDVILAGLRQHDRCQLADTPPRGALDD